MRLAAIVSMLVFAACGSTTDAPADPETGLPRRTGSDGASDAGRDAAGDATILDGSGASTTCTISLDATLAGTVRTSGDDNFELYVNGTLVKKFDGLWTDPQTDAVTLSRHPSRKNVIAARASNVVKVDGLDRMLVLDLTFDAGSGVQHVVTDATWLRSPGGLETNWFAVDFAEANWTAPTIVGSHGDPPWGAILGTSTAQFLWSYHAGMVDQTTKPDAETVWFRKSFYLDASGAPQSAPGTCN